MKMWDKFALHALLHRALYFILGYNDKPCIITDKCFKKESNALKRICKNYISLIFDIFQQLQNAKR